MEVFGRAGTGVPPKQQVVDGQLALSVALTLRQQLLHSKQQLGQRSRPQSEAGAAEDAPVERPTPSSCACGLGAGGGRHTAWPRRCRRRQTGWRWWSGAGSGAAAAARRRPEPSGCRRSGTGSLLDTTAALRLDVTSAFVGTARLLTVSPEPPVHLADPLNPVFHFRGKAKLLMIKCTFRKYFTYFS